MPFTCRRSRATAAAITLLLSSAVARADEHAGLLLNAAEAREIRAALGTTPLLDRSLAAARESMASVLASPVAVPPPGEAGSTAHERHKQNGVDILNAALLYQITGEERYARRGRDLLVAYARTFPGLPPHPAGGGGPGRIFHQALNDSVWLVHAAQGYDGLRSFLGVEERQLVERDLLRSMAAWLAGEAHFARIHNWGTWSSAAVGLAGYALGDSALVDVALHGPVNDRSRGFLHQMDLLFSPDGHYLEGPYYARYALLPFFALAEAVERHQPERHIYAYRDRILKKAYDALVRTALPDGRLPALNDSSRSMGLQAEAVIFGNALTGSRYGAEPEHLSLAVLHGRVPLTKAGLELARAVAAAGEVPPLSLGSLELRDGPDGDRGGIGILRAGRGRDQTMLLMKYGAHGMGHGHFDTLSFLLYDGGQVVVPDYGYARFINVETKSGGRYLPENATWAATTIAHNTLVVDETSQYGGRHADADLGSGRRHFFDARDPDVQVMSARSRGDYEGVEAQRTMLLVRDARLERPVVVDVLRVTGATPRQYDYPIHFDGHIMTTTLKVTRPGTLAPLGAGSGYQHLWNEGQAAVAGPAALTWLAEDRFYTFVGATTDGDQVVFARTGAADPAFNLRSEPMFLLRRRATSTTFASVIEPHGAFDEGREVSRQARGTIESVRVLGDTAEATVVEVAGGGGLRWTIAVANGEAAEAARAHDVEIDGRRLQWTGTHHVSIEGPGPGPH
jgi:oligo-alginate lyase